MKNIRTRDNCDIYALLTSVILLIIGFTLAGRLFFSNYTVLIGDLYGLYAPIYRMFVAKIMNHNDLFGPGNFFYATNAGYGLDISSFASGDALLSPFNLFFLIFENENVACCCLIISKLSFAAFFFQRYLRRVHSISGFTSICWSVLYSMCGYCTVYYLNILFLDGVYLLPLIITLCYELIYKNTSTIKLTLTYFVMFLCGVFVSYILGIFSFLFFALCLVFSGINGKIQKLGMYFKAVVLSFVMSLFLILPTVVSLLTLVASDSTQYNGSIPGIVYMLGNMMVGMTQTVVGQIPYLYSGLLAFVFVPLFFISTKIDLKKKIVWGLLTLFFVLCCLVPFLYIMIHGFNYPDSYGYRFAYLLSFCFISFVAIGFNNIKEMNNIFFYVGLVGGLIVYTYLFSNLHAQGTSEFGLLINIIFSLSYICLLFFRNKKSILDNIICIVVMAEIICNFYMVSINEGYNIVNYKPLMDEAETELRDEINNIKQNDNSVYRVNIPNALSLSYQFTADTLSGNLFSSIEDEQARNTAFGLGMQTSVRLLTDHGLTDATKMILGYKYDVISDGIVVGEKIDVPYNRVNPYYLGIGYMVSNDINELYFDDYNAFSNINKTLSAMVGEKTEYFSPANVEITTSLDGVESIDMNNGYNAFILSDGYNRGIVALTFDGEDDYYGYSMLDFTTYIPTDPTIYSIGGDEGNFTMSQCVYTPQIIKIGKDEAGMNNLRYSISADNTDTFVYYKDILIYNDNDEELQYVYNQLKNNIYQIEVFEDGYIKGNIEVTEDRNVLFMSIAYNGNWKCYVDGKETDIKPGLNDAFITCELTPGNHDVLFIYKNPFVFWGNVASVVGFILFISDIFIYKRKNKLVTIMQEGMCE